MAHHAGFALAIALKESAINRTLLLGHHAGAGPSFKTTLPRRDDSELDLDIDFFLGAPTISCRAATPAQFELAVEGWGSVTMGDDTGNTMGAVGQTREKHGVKWRAVLSVTPNLEASGGQLSLSQSAGDYVLTDWHLDNLNPPGPVDPNDNSGELQPDRFRPRIDEPLRAFLALHMGPLASTVVNTPGTISFTDTRVLDGALAAGYSLGAAQGAVEELSDFTGSEELALALHPNWVQPLFFPTAEADLAALVQTSGGELKRVALKVLEGAFRVDADLRAPHADVALTLTVEPVLFAERQGGSLSHPKHTIHVRPRRWGILGFQITHADADVDLDNWLVALAYGIGGLIGGVPGGLLAYWALSLVGEQAQDGADGSIGTPVGDDKPALRRIITPSARAGDPAVTTKLERFDIHADGVELAISSKSPATLAHITGPASLARNLINEKVRFGRQLGLHIHPDDPALRVNWEVRDASTDALLLAQDANAADPYTLAFAPAALANNLNELSIRSTISRKIGASLFEIDERTVTLSVGPALPANAFVRWRYDVKIPQVRFPVEDGPPQLASDTLRHRWSAIHRTDRPCRNASHRSRYRFEEHVMDALPFPLAELDAKRSLLCAYCFYGGPGRDRALL